MSVGYYRWLLTHRKRIEAFRAAIHETVRPGDTVLEVGAGLAPFSFFAAEAGASKVWAVEGDPIIHVARATARVNGLSDRVECVRAWIPDWRVPEPVDVLIYEDFPPGFMTDSTHKLLTRLFDDYLKPDGRLVATAARLMVAPASSEQLREWIFPRELETATVYGIDWSATREYAANAPVNGDVPADYLCAAPALLGEVAVRPAPGPEALTGTVHCTLSRDCEVHGLVLWFELGLANGCWLSNAPGVEPCSWGRLLLSLDPPLHGAQGDEVRITVGREALTGGAPGWLTWEASIGEDKRRGHEFAAEPASLTDLYGEASSEVAKASDGTP